MPWQRNTPEIVLSKLNKNGPIPPERPDLGPCWIGPWRPTGGGYRTVCINYKHQQLHIVIYEYIVGPVPPGKVLDHLCRNHECGNPFHVEPVTTQENILRGIGVASINAKKVSCDHGHPLSGVNLRVNRDGSRACRMCQRNAQARYRKRKVSV